MTNKPEEFEPDKGDVLKFQEQEALVTEVKDKIADVIGNRGSPQIIQSRDALKFLKKHLGMEVAAVLCTINEIDLPKVMRAKNPLALTPLQTRNIAAAYLIADILFSHLDSDIAKSWLIEYNDYLHGFPIIEIGRRPEDVRMAALWFISTGRAE